MVKKALGFLFFILVVVGGGWYIESRLHSLIKEEIKRQSTEFCQKESQLVDRISQWEHQLSKLESIVESNTRCFDGFDKEKWNAWCKLRSDLRKGKDFAENLLKFKEIFSSEGDIVKAVDDTILASQCNWLNNKKFTKYLRKYVSIFCVNEEELLKIDAMIFINSVKWRM
ncbi:MAG: hypothetical protein E7015_00275 [Alphaproteobacteria bacterium]|nr:hypothetical protein [Alphaproteobacteria bacterium]